MLVVYISFKSYVVSRKSQLVRNMNWNATMPKQWENQKQRNGVLVLEKWRFNLVVPDRYVEFPSWSEEYIRNQSIFDKWWGMNTSYKELARLGGPVAPGNFYTGGKKCKPHRELFPVLSNRFNPCHTISYFCYNTKKTVQKMSAQEWMGRLQTKVAECEYR